MIKYLKINLLYFLIGCSFLVVSGYQLGCSSKRISQTTVTDTLYTNQDSHGFPLKLSFVKGKEHNHPLMAVWITDTNNTYIETLFIVESLAKGVFGHGDKSTGKWKPGAIRRPAALPVWSHSRGIKESDGLYVPTPETPIVDAISGATPQGNFILHTKITKDIPRHFHVYFEINQTWNWNEYWTNNKYPENEEYKTSCQPALVYRGLINKNDKGGITPLELIGHSHHSGENGLIYPTLETITTAKEITEIITVNL